MKYLNTEYLEMNYQISIEFLDSAQFDFSFKKLS